ncbi:MAG: YitT family protein [Endomicrobiales bacterium]
MKMGCLFFNGFFWGSLLIALGALIILKVLFNIDIPVFRILFALLLIYLGVKVLVGGPFCCRARGVVPPAGPATGAPGAAQNEYHVLFGKGVIDLTGVSVEQGTVRKNLDTVFGSSVVRIDPAMPVEITVNAVFAGARMPDGNLISFGKYTYRSPGFKEGANALMVDASVVFGGLDIILTPKK